MFVLPWFLEEIGEETSHNIENEYSGYSLSDRNRDRTNLPLLSVAMGRAVVYSLWYHAFSKSFPSPNPGRALPQATLRLWLPPVRLSSGFPTQWFYARDRAMTESDRWTCQFTHKDFRCSSVLTIGKGGSLHGSSSKGSGRKGNSQRSKRSVHGVIAVLVG